MRKLFTVLLTAALLSFPAFATIIHIPGDYPTIQAGIDAAVDGDTVLVADGYYNESVDFLGKSISLISENGAESTTIDPDSNAFTVNMWSEEPLETLLEGFTVTNSYYSPSGGLYLCGIYCSGSAVIRNNIIRDNGAVWSMFGGGIHAWNASPIIEYNQIRSNQCVYYGGGIYIANCDTAVVRHNTICENYVYSGYGMAYGGGIHIQKSNVLVERNLIINNWADPNYCRGGALSIVDSSIVYIYNNTFSGNQGDGICVQGNFEPGQLQFVNNILVDTYGYGLFSPWSFSNIFIDYNDIYNNSQGGYYNCQPGEHDISADPLFVNAGAGDYHLTENSPCIDAGDPESPLDPDGTIADIGAFYYDQSVWVAPDSPSPQPTAYSLLPAHPNPFNASTAISYQLQADS